MTDFGAMRTGRLVVRYQAPWRRPLVVCAAVLVAALVLYLIYEWGRAAGGFSKVAELQQRRGLMAKIASLQQDNEKLRANATAATLGRDVDSKAYADVEKTLADLQSQLLKQREELTFYRGIVSPKDGVDGLRIQQFRVLAAGADNHYRLRLVLVQSMRQDTMVSGSIGVEIEGVRDNRPENLVVADAGGGKSEERLPFQFKYFQNLEHDVELPQGFEPLAVNVEIRTAKLDPMRESYPWQVQSDAE
jgi:hypothetical protein